MSRNDEVLGGGDIGKSDPQSGVNLEPAPESVPDASAEPEPQSEPEFVDYFSADAVEANATTGPAEASESTEASERPAPASRGDIPALRALARDAERTVGSILGSYDFGVAAQTRPLQDIVRSASGMDRLTANLQNLVKLPQAFDYVMGARLKVLQDIAGSAVTRPFYADLERVNQTIQDIARTAMPNASVLAVDQFRFLDKVTPLAVQPLQLSVSADLARNVFANTAVETWRMSLLAQSNVARLASVQLSDVSPALLGVLAARAEVAAGLSERLAGNFPGKVLDGATAQTARAWQRYTALKPTAHRLEMSAAAGSAVGGIIGSDLLLITEGVEAEELAADIDAQVVEPWHTGAIAARTDLHAALQAIDPSIADFLIGGWEDVERKGAAAASKIAHCVVEAVDHTLRALAPPEAAAAWLRRDGRTPAKTDFDDKGKPTRRGRIAYALRNRPGDRLLVQNQEAALAGLVAQVQGQAQGVKHAPGAATVTYAQTLLVTAEGLLMQLVLP
ncbi:hypothetical protein [Micromonospora arida]|uniref:hypothetical protein n=1 Tax=Micromonospora arida TaxID=2203715 RepID=UPI0033ACBBF3